MSNRDKILNCSLNLFCRKGYESVAVSQICKEAGITKPTLYHYFKSKYGLLEALLEEKYNEYGLRLEQESYACETFLIPIEEVMMHEKIMPDEFINERGNDVTSAFVEWCKPLIGEDLPDYTDFYLGTRKEKI